MRRRLGTVVFSGMLGVTVFGIFFTPVFYAVIERLRERGRRICPCRVSHEPLPTAACPGHAPAECPAPGRAAGVRISHRVVLMAFCSRPQ